MSGYKAKEEINSWLKKTGLAEQSQKTLLTEAVSIYEELNNRIPHIGEKELAKDALHLACDKYSCAVNRDIPQPKMSSLSAARKKMGVERLEPIDKVDAMVNLLNTNASNPYADTAIDALKVKAKGILTQYKEKFQNEYYRGSPSVTAAAAVKLASDSSGNLFTEIDIRSTLGISDSSMRDKKLRIKDDLKM